MKGAPALLPVLLFLLASDAASAGAIRAKKNPLGQVVTLLDSLSAKIAKEGEEELKAYNEYMAWCSDAATNKKFEIKSATAKKDKLSSVIGKMTSDIEAAETKIEEVAGSISKDEADLKDATTIRNKESADFVASEGELVDVIDTLGRAIGILQREMSKHPGAFAQVDASNSNSVLRSLAAVVDAASFSLDDRQKLSALVQSQQTAATEADEQYLNAGAPDAEAYKSHSTNIIDVLEDLKEKAEEQLAALRKAETTSRQNFEMLKQSLEDQIGASSKDMDEVKANKAQAAETKATAEGDLSSTTKDLADAKTALQTAQTTCMQTATDHDATVAARTEELKVIAEAKKLIVESTSGAEEQSYSLLQLGSAGASISHGRGRGRQESMTQLRTHADLEGIEVVAVVKNLAKEHHSAALSQLASRISAVLRYGTGGGEDPFAKVKALITDMIKKLEAESGADATEKSYCDEQMAKTEEKKEELGFDVSKLTSKIDKAVAHSNSLKEDVKEAQAELAKLAKEQAEMDKTRQESHKAYVEAKADLQQGLEGVRKALQVLQEYYSADSSASSALLQGEQPDPPKKFEKKAGAGSSIISILEVVESDFAKSLAIEETQEADEQAEYEKVSMQNKVTRSMKDQDVKYMTQEIKSLEKSLSELTSDRETANTELSAVLEYYAQIKDRCIAKPESYEQRKERRQAEISGLKEALNILEEQAAFTQSGTRGLHRHRRFLQGAALR